MKWKEGTLHLKLKGKKISLVSLDECNLQKLWKLIYHEQIPEWKKWDAPYYPFKHLSYEEFRDSIDKIMNSIELVMPRFAIESLSGELIGTVSYYWEHKESLWLEIGIAIYNPDFWNGGYGTEALELWIQYLFDSMPLVRIGLATWSGNTRMIRCAEKLGMQIEARIRKARLYNSEFYDSIRMGVLREEWESRITEKTDSSKEGGAI